MSNLDRAPRRSLPRAPGSDTPHRARVQRRPARVILPEEYPQALRLRLDRNSGEGSDCVDTDRDFTEEQLAFLKVVDAFRQTKKFPDVCDYLEILKGLGYGKEIAAPPEGNRQGGAAGGDAGECLLPLS